MPINPTPKYRIKFNGQYLPGYLQAEDIPLNARTALFDILNRDGGTFYSHGIGFRNLTLNFRVLTRKDHVTGMVHLGDCLEQYREGLRIATRVLSASTLFIADTDHYLLARFKRASAPLAAPDNQAISYQLDFDTLPFFYGPTVSVTDFISGNDNIILNMTDTRRTYPSITIPSGITGITVAHAASNKSFVFSGAHTQSVTVNCANLTVKNADGTNAIERITSNPDFGFTHTIGSGSMQLDITGVTGQGDVLVAMTPRLER